VNASEQELQIDLCVLQNQLRTQFVNELTCIPSAMGQLGGEVAEKASRCTIESILELLDKGHGDVRYRLMAKCKGKHPVVINGDLLKLFDAINT